MLIKKRMGEVRSLVLVWVAVICFGSVSVRAEAQDLADGFQLKKDEQGLILPFKTAGLPLWIFIKEYSRFTGTPIIAAGKWEQELKGSVTLFLHRSLKQDDLAEIFHRVLADNGYTALEGAGGNGWVIERQRDARDDGLPFYDISDVPDSNRLVTVSYNLKYAQAESVARMMRSFMPAFSRIIPVGTSQLFLTDTASNIRKLRGLVSRMDNPEAAKKQRESLAASLLAPARSCGEYKIEKLVVEKLEIQESGGTK